LKFLLVFIAAILVSVNASAFEISEATLNAYVEQKLAEKPNREVKFVNPKISLFEGFATICATAQSRFLPRDADFCANMTPMWRKETGALLATKMALVSLNAPGVSEKNVEFLRMMLNQIVLPRLEGVEIYKTDNFMGKQLSAIKVLPGKLDLSFW
jgi:hypothetical protein